MCPAYGINRSGFPRTVSGLSSAGSDVTEYGGFTADDVSTRRCAI